MTDQVPAYPKGRVYGISTIVGEKIEAAFTRRPEFEFNLIQEGVLRQAGIEIPVSGQRLRLNVAGNSFTGQKVIVPTIRFGKHVMKDVEFLTVPAGNAEIGNVLGGQSLDTFNVQLNEEQFAYTITAIPGP